MLGREQLWSIKNTIVFQKNQKIYSKCSFHNVLWRHTFHLFFSTKWFFSTGVSVFHRNKIWKVRLDENFFEKKRLFGKLIGGNRVPRSVPVGVAYGTLVRDLLDRQLKGRKKQLENLVAQKKKEAGEYREKLRKERENAMMSKSKSHKKDDESEKAQTQESQQAEQEDEREGTLKMI